MSENKNTPDAEQKKSSLGCLFPIVGFLVLAGIGYVSTRMTSPERLADVNQCIGPSGGEPAYQNTCDYPIHLQYCFFSDAGPERDMCRNTELSPGQGLDQQTLDNDLAELGGLFRADFLACKTPFLPGQFEYWNTRRMRAGCVQPDDPFAGPHIFRPGHSAADRENNQSPTDLDPES